MKRLVLLATLLCACGHAAEVARPYKPTSRAEERAELVAQLKRDLVKVDRSIAVTERLIEQSRSAPYLPDLLFRLAELYIEKSRYRFRLESEQRADAGRGSLVVPEVTLLKQKAISLHERIIREFPDFKDLDKVRFFAAHEYRELGQYDRALKTLNELAKKHPSSPLVAEALLIVADYYFDKSQLDQAETYYLRVLEQPASPAQGLAEYKLGWVWINRGKHAEAVKHFEAAAKATAAESGAKALNVRSLALSDLVYSYTESRPAKGAVEYFEALCDSSTLFEKVLEKLANRYYIKQDFESAAPAYRRLLLISRSFDRDPERVERLYEAIKASKGKVSPRADDVKAMVRVAARARLDTRMADKDRDELLTDLEVYSRDLATTLHVDAQRRNDKAAFSEAADAYGAYLELFRNEKHELAMMKNRAEALFAAGRFAEAGREYERVAKRSEGDARQAPLYSALVSFQSALRDPDKLTAFERTDSRYALRLVGADFVRAFPKAEGVAKVKFNMARAYYDEGEFRQASELFAAFAGEYPTDADASPAAHLALDGLHALKDYKALAATGERLLAVAGLPAPLRDELKGILSGARTEELAEAVIATDTGDEGAVKRLMKIADDPARAGGDLAERALSTAFGHAVGQRDLAAADEVAAKILQQFPKSASAANVILTKARLAVETGDFDAAAAHYESMVERFGDDAKAFEALDNAGTLRALLGDTARAVADFEKVATATRRGEAFAKLAEARFAAGDYAGAVTAAQGALKLDSGSARAAAVMGEALLAQNRPADAEQALLAAGPALQRAAQQSDPDALAKVYFLWGEAVNQQFLALGPDALERKAGLLQTLQQAYTSAAQLGGSWAVAGLFRMASALKVLSETLEKVPEPPGLKDRDRALLRATLAKQANELRAGSNQAFEACAKKARELEVYTPFAQACLTKAEPPPKAAMPAAIAAQDSAALKPLREALAKNPGDVAALEGLGKAWLEAGDLRRARLAYGRALEIDENRAPSHAAMGYLSARLGEPELAVRSLARALEIDGRDEHARANLASLKCRYGDPQGARAELAHVKGSPSGPDVLPEWGACRR